MKHSIAIIIAWFGKWPIWINFFIESCKANPRVDWIIFSDCDPLENQAENVRVINTSFNQYKQIISDKLSIEFNPPLPYKLCDVRPALPFVHNDILNSYDFVGFGDLDVIYGRIRNFYNSEILGHYSVLSTHPERVSGHFFLMRQTNKLINAFKIIPDWEEKMAHNE